MAPILPPCRICTEKASGLHYGLNTCEACKVFFRRSLQKGTVYKCAEDNCCEILPGRRSACSACRFNKCIALGMCKEAIKNGRYTHEKTAENIKEVKRLEQKDWDSLPSIKSVSSVSSVSSLSSYTKSPSPPMFHEIKTFVVNERLEKIIFDITFDFLQRTPFTEEFYEKLPQKKKDFLEKQAKLDEVFGPMKPIPMDEYRHLYQMTGIDLDGRREFIVQEMPHIEQAIKRFISFAKTIPGFNELCVDDQIALIKCSRFEVWMIICHRLFDTKHRLYATQSGKIVSVEDMLKYQEGHLEMIDLIFSLEGKFQKLEMSVEEMCIMSALCVMLPDISLVKNVELIEKSQALILECLLYLFQKYHSSDRLRFAQFMNCLLLARTIKEYHVRAEESFASEWGTQVDFPPLLYEIWSS